MKNSEEGLKFWQLHEECSLIVKSRSRKKQKERMLMFLKSKEPN